MQLYFLAKLELVVIIKNVCWSESKGLITWWEVVGDQVKSRTTINAVLFCNSLELMSSFFVILKRMVKKNILLKKSRSFFLQTILQRNSSVWSIFPATVARIWQLSDISILQRDCPLEKTCLKFWKNFKFLMLRDRFLRILFAEKNLKSSFIVFKINLSFNILKEC